MDVFGRMGFMVIEREREIMDKKFWLGWLVMSYFKAI
jgi:hypothetical protein